MEQVNKCAFDLRKYIVDTAGWSESKSLNTRVKVNTKMTILCQLSIQSNL